jgi:nitroreductase
MLAAHELGLGSVWVSCYPRVDRMDGFRNLVHLPEHVQPLAFVALGHPGETPRAGQRFREERIHRNRW